MEAPAKVECPKCHHSNAPGTSRCAICDSVLEDLDATMMNDATMMTNAAVGTNWSRNTKARDDFDLPTAAALAEGSIIAERYEILKLLGQGGMGAVYKAKDRELDRLVALKVIRPELAGHASILQRFKQELLLARKITHRNIIRIYDLGVAEGLRFITMEFVEGQDLSSLLEERHKYPPEEAVTILRQVCAALEAAHNEGVVHRDLKPQNIMMGAGGRVCVMDFGLARSMEGHGMTQAGAVMGTPAYMSPEQAKGMPVDQRSDLYTLGIIAYVLLTGEIPFKADSALASMLLRTQGPPTPSIQLDPSIPQKLSDVVQKALAVDPQDRYQTAAEFAKDLEDWQEGTLAREIVTPRVAMMAESNAKKWIALAVGCAIVLAAAGYGVERWLHRPHGPISPKTVLIADFNNHTGDPVFTGTLESTLKLALESASFISAYDRTKMRDLGVKPISGVLDDSQAQQIAVSQGLNVVVSGALDSKGAGYQLTLRAILADTGKVLANDEESASGKDQVLFAVTKGAVAIRTALGDSTSESDQRFSMETLSAGSLEAVHEYAAGSQDLASKNEEALKHFSQAVDLDMNFGLAYVGMATASYNLGRPQDAEKYIKQAITHIDRMTERERFRTRAFLYLLISDPQKCIEEYGALLAKYPSDPVPYNNMAICSTELRNMPQAIDEIRHAMSILPKRMIFHVNLSFYSAYGGDFETASKEATVVLQQSSTYPPGFQAQAFAGLGQGDLAKVADAYKKLEKINPSDAALGFGDLAVYEGRFNDAVQLLQKGAAADMASRTLDAAADKYAMLAYVQTLRGKNAPALDAAKNALDASQAVKTRFIAARTFVAAGENAKAQELAKGLGTELQVEPQAYAKLIQGEIALNNKDAQGAVKQFTEANNLLDTWIGRFDLGRAYLELGAFPEADSEFDRCLKRRGEALALFVDEVPTYGYLPPVYYYQGRARGGMKSAGFAESYRKYLDIRGKAGEDPLLAEVRRLAGK
jgi:tetratricopeptide (TPR) repeat protein/predicted Ser/Thr protein kinase